VRHACIILLLSLSVAAQVKTGDGVVVIWCRVQSAHLKYSGMGKLTGRSYSGVVQVKVLRILDETSLATSTVVRQDNSVPVHVEEGTKRPAWELQTGRDFVLAVQPRATGGLKPLFVIATETSPEAPESGFAECVGKAGFLRDVSGAPVWLSSVRLHELVVQAHPMEMPGLMDGHAKGHVTLFVLVGGAGKMECAQVADGHPLLLAAAIDAATKYRFRPYSVKGHDSPVLGTLILEYDFHRGDH